MAERKAMIDATHALSISRQAQLAGISRGSVYDVPQGCRCGRFGADASPGRVALGAPIDSARMLRDQLNREGVTVGWKHVGTLMPRMGMEALYRKPGPARSTRGMKFIPICCAGSPSTGPTRCGQFDTTYIPMAKGFVYLTAVVDWASRKVLAEKVAITLETCHAVEVFHETFTRHGKLEIVSTDQGSQFSAQAFVQAVKEQGCKLSMDGRGAWRDIVFVERLLKSVKYERVYLYAYDSVTEARTSITQYLGWYNQSRPHLSLGMQTPDEAYAVMLPTSKPAV